MKIFFLFLSVFVTSFAFGQDDGSKRKLFQADSICKSEVFSFLKSQLGETFFAENLSYYKSYGAQLITFIVKCKKCKPNKFLFPIFVGNYMNDRYDMSCNLKIDTALMAISKKDILKCKKGKYTKRLIMTEVEALKIAEQHAPEIINRNHSIYLSGNGINNVYIVTIPYNIYRERIIEINPITGEITELMGSMVE
ncbi:MAG: PepSY domain-containing protein [Bacteroidetes bacterium]|nr:PepSY domain-containing protein [Bacteroidota bacterium]